MTDPNPVPLSASVDVMVLVTNEDDTGTASLLYGRHFVGGHARALLSDPDGNVRDVTWTWARGNSASGPFTDIAGATSGNHYMVTEADLGKYLRASASYTDSHGSGKSARATSEEPVGPNPRAEGDPPVERVIRFDSSSHRVNEGGRYATVRLVSRLESGGTPAGMSRRVVVPLSVSYGGGATSADHSNIPAEVVFQRGQSERTFRVTAPADDSAESGEWIEITIGSLSAEQNIERGSPATVRVYLDDAPTLRQYTVEFRDTTYTANEGNHATVFLELDATTGRDLDIPVHHSLGSGEGAYEFLDQPNVGRFTSEWFAHRYSPVDIEYVEDLHRLNDFRIECEEDSIDRDDWTVSLRLEQESMPAGVTVGTNATATVTCQDNDDPATTRVQFSRGYYTLHEDGNFVEVGVQLSEALDREVTIPISHQPLNGATNDDYLLYASSVTFAAGDRFKSFRAVAIDDAIDDDTSEDGVKPSDSGNEQVELTFGTLPSGVVAASGNHDHDLRKDWVVLKEESRLLLVDNDATPVSTPGTPDTLVYFLHPRLTVREGEAVTVHVIRDPVGGRLEVPLAIARLGPGVGAVESEPTAVFVEGHTRSTLRFEAQDDEIDNDGRWVELGFGDLPQGVSEDADRAPTRVDIIDDDYPEVEANFDSETYSVTEFDFHPDAYGDRDDPAAQQARAEAYAESWTEVTVTLDADPEREVLVVVRLSAAGGAGARDFSLGQAVGLGTARLRGDALWADKKDDATSGTIALRFRPDEPLSKKFIVQSIDDRDDDDGEWVAVSFESLPERMSAGPDARVNIVDNDIPPTVVVYAAIVTRQHASEDGGPATVEVELNKALEQDLVIPLVLSRLGGATADDHSAVPGSVTIPAGEDTVTFQVWATDDDLDDDGESLEITMGTPEGNYDFRAGQNGRYESATVELRDND